MKRNLLLLVVALLTTMSVFSQRKTDKLDRGLIAMKVSNGVFLSWRILGEEYYDVSYNVYRDGTLITQTPLNVSNYTDKSGTLSSKYTVEPVWNGSAQSGLQTKQSTVLSLGAQSTAVTPWANGYKEIKLTHEDIASTLVPNDACCADVDGDGELEILMKFDNLSEMQQSYPKNGPTVGGKVTHEYTIFEALKQNGERLWWVNCGPNMGDFQNNEQNIVAYDWDGDGMAEAIFRAADGTEIHAADGKTYVVGDKNKNWRGATGGGTNWFMHAGAEYLVYVNGKTGIPYQLTNNNFYMEYPLKRLENSENPNNLEAGGAYDDLVNRAWGDGYGHRSSKHFFGAPYLDGRKPSIFLARGIYTRHKMIAYDVNPETHKLEVRWTWYNNTNGPWKGQGYHNYAIADVDLDGRDEIVFGSMVIDDNGKGLSTTGLGHGDAEHVSDLNPYIHGLEIYACLEDHPGNNYRDATTSKIYHRFVAGNDDGRAMAGNFCNDFPGSLGCSAREGAISLVKNEAVSGLGATGVNTNFRIYWDGDLCEETFNYLNGKNTEGCVVKYGSWSPIYICEGSMTNNDTKGTPCYQGDIFGDWREEIIMRTADNNIRIYSTPTATKWRNYTLWHDHQYRNAMVWQMCGYNQPPHASYFLGELEKITVAPPPLTLNGRTEIANGGAVNATLNNQHVIVCETNSTTVSIENGAKPYILTFNIPSWVQGTAPSECSTASTKINYQTYTCDVTGGGLAGDARLVKQGDGILNLPKADFAHTGETSFWSGTVNFDGTMKQSPLTLHRFAELNSNGGEFKTITMEYGSILRPGGADSKGTITADSLGLGFGSRIIIDLYSEGTSCDILKLNKLSIEKKAGSAWTAAGPEYLSPVIELVGHPAGSETNVAPGKYVIAELNSANDLKGSVENIIIEGLKTQKKTIYMEDNKLIIEIVKMREASNITWNGIDNGIWDFAETENFLNTLAGSEPTYFTAGDQVTFDESAANKTITIKDKLIPSSVTVNSTSAYTFDGDGSIEGDASFTKEGSGTVTINTQNSYTKGNFLKGGTVKVSSLANQYSATGNLGGITKSANLFTMENGAVLQTTANVEQASPMKMIGEEGGVINNSGEFLMNAAMSGTLLTKKGAGSLKFGANSTLTRLVVSAGHIDCNSGNPAQTVVLLNGTIWDNTQATTHTIEVPKSRTGTWNLTNTYYTAYTNKVVGEGTLTINPRNTVSRVRISANMSEFTGTVKHTNTNIWLPLDNSYGLPNGTLDIAENCNVTNVCKVFKIGKLTGKGGLRQPISDFKSQTPVTGSNTWKVGNSTMGNFTFDGIIGDDGGTNKSHFEKIGTCKMTVTGKWTNTGTVTISEGELQVKSGALLGKGALTVQQGAILSGVTGSGDLTNSSYTINGTLQVGSTPATTSGAMNFNNTDVTFSANSILATGVRKASDGVRIKNIKTMTMNGTVSVFVPTTHALKLGDEIVLWEATTTEGTPKLANVVIDEQFQWNTSRLNEGILIVEALDPATGIEGINAETSKFAIFTLDGRYAGTDEQTLSKGIYIRNGKKIIVK